MKMKTIGLASLLGGCAIMSGCLANSGGASEAVADTGDGIMVDARCFDEGGPFLYQDNADKYTFFSGSKGETAYKPGQCVFGQWNKTEFINPTHKMPAALQGEDDPVFKSPESVLYSSPDKARAESRFRIYRDAKNGRKGEYVYELMSANGFGDAGGGTALGLQAPLPDNNRSPDPYLMDQPVWYNIRLKLKQLSLTYNDDSPHHRKLVDGFFNSGITFHYLVRDGKGKVTKRYPLFLQIRHATASVVGSQQMVGNNFSVTNKGHGNQPSGFLWGGVLEPDKYITAVEPANAGLTAYRFKLNDYLCNAARKIADKLQWTGGERAKVLDLHNWEVRSNYMGLETANGTKDSAQAARLSKVAGQAIKVGTAYGDIKMTVQIAEPHVFKNKAVHLDAGYCASSPFIDN